jgi:hypothetical protein
MSLSTVRYGHAASSKFVTIHSSRSPVCGSRIHLLLLHRFHRIPRLESFHTDADSVPVGRHESGSSVLASMTARKAMVGAIEGWRLGGGAMWFPRPERPSARSKMPLVVMVVRTLGAGVECELFHRPFGVWPGWLVRGVSSLLAGCAQTLYRLGGRMKDVVGGGVAVGAPT